MEHGIKRRASSFNTARVDRIYQDPHVDHLNFVLHYGNLTDSTNLIRIAWTASARFGYLRRSASSVLNRERAFIKLE